MFIAIFAISTIAAVFPSLTLPCGSTAEVGPNIADAFAVLAVQPGTVCAVCDHFRWVWIGVWRFDGVVGYRICLTHRRPPVRARVEPFLHHKRRPVQTAHVKRA